MSFEDFLFDEEKNIEKYLMIFDNNENFTNKIFEEFKSKMLMQIDIFDKNTNEFILNWISEMDDKMNNNINELLEKIRFEREKINQKKNNKIEILENTIENMMYKIDYLKNNVNNMNNEQINELLNYIIFENERKKILMKENENLINNKEEENDDDLYIEEDYDY